VRPFAQRLDQTGLPFAVPTESWRGYHVERALDRGGIGRNHAVADELVDRHQIRPRVLHKAQAAWHVGGGDDVDRGLAAATHLLLASRNMASCVVPSVVVPVRPHRSRRVDVLWIWPYGDEHPGGGIHYDHEIQFLARSGVLEQGVPHHIDLARHRRRNGSRPRADRELHGTPMQAKVAWARSASSPISLVKSLGSRMLNGTSRHPGRS